MRQLKRTLSLILVFVMVLGFIPDLAPKALARSSFHYDNSQHYETLKKIPGEAQSVDPNGTGICPSVAIATLLRRRNYVDNGILSDTFTLDTIRNAMGSYLKLMPDGSGPKLYKTNSGYLRRQYTNKIIGGNDPDGNNQTWTLNRQNGDIITYKVTKMSYPSRADVIDKLSSHPEGVVARFFYSYKNKKGETISGWHSIVLTDYTDGTLNANDGVDAGNDYIGGASTRAFSKTWSGQITLPQKTEASFLGSLKYILYVSDMNIIYGCDHASRTDDGYCENPECGQDYLSDPTYKRNAKAADGEIHPNGQRIAVNERPYAASPEISSYHSGSIPVNGTVVNHFGNTWYKVVDPDTGRDGYVYCTQKSRKLLKAYYEEGYGRIQEGNTIHKPSGELKQNKGFRMEGTLVSTKFDFSYISVEVLNADGSIATRKDNGNQLLYRPSNTHFKVFDIHDANDAIALSKLNPGKYTLKIEARADTSSYGASGAKKKQAETANHFLEKYDFWISDGKTAVPTYTVKADSNGGTTGTQEKKVKSGQSFNLWDFRTPSWPKLLSSSDDTHTAVITAPEYASANYQPVIHTKEAQYTFEGWSENPNSAVPEYKSTDTYTPRESTTLYAVWSEIAKPAAPNMTQPSMDIAQNGNVSVSWWSVSNAEKYIATVYAADGSEYRRTETVGTSAAFNLPDAGEYTVRVRAANAAGESGDSQSVAVHVHAPSTVSFLNYDGSVWASQSVPYGGSAATPAEPNRAGYTFTGWSGSMADVKADRTLTATYSAIPYQVTFYGYEGEGQYRPISVQTITYNGDQPGSAVEPAVSQLNVREGRTFIGWDTDEWRSVTRDNVNVYPCSVWSDETVPISTSITGVNQAGTGYWIDYTVRNEIGTAQTGRVVVTLKSAVGRFLCKTESGAFYIDGNSSRTGSIYVPVETQVQDEEAYAELYVVKSFNSLVPISKVSWEMLKTTEERWSEWMTDEQYAAYTGDKTHPQHRTEYRTSSRETTGWTEQTNIPGWTRIDQRTIKSDYSAWSQWSNTPAYANDNQIVETRQVMSTAAYTEYRYGRWIRGSGDNNSYCSARFRSGSPDPVVDYSQWSTTRFPIVGNDYTCGNLSLDGRGHDHSHAAYYEDGKPYWHPYSSNGSSDKAARYFWEESRTIPATYITQYRYATRRDITQYRFERWLNWSDWSTTPVSATAELRVESRNLHRVKIPVGSSGTGKDLLGSVTGISNPDGKLAILTIYKVDEASDYSNEYIGQTTLGADGSYCFSDINTFEDPSLKTGDFTATLTVQGSDGPLFVDTQDLFKAPRQTYTVTFIDGVTQEPIGEPQTVEEGGNATAPEVPEKEGYTFLGWDNGTKNIRSNMEIKARFVKNNYVVVFVDWMHGTITMMENIPYGSTIYGYSGETIPDGEGLYIREPESVDGYAFLGWKTDSGEDFSTVTRNMVVNAVFDRFQYNVTFLGTDGSVISEQTVGYGDSASAPDVEEMTADDNMVISGWSSPDYDNVTRDMTVSPILVYMEDAYPAEVSLEPGVYAGPQTVSIEAPTENAEITYMLIGSGSDEAGDQIYTEPITLTESSVLEVTTKEEGANSVTERFEYVIVPDTSRPEAPTGLSATANSQSVSLQWSAVQGADGYIIYRVDEYGNESRFITESCSYVDNSVRAVLDYTYALKAYTVFKSGESETFLISNNESEPAQVRFFGESNAVEAITINAPENVMCGNAVLVTAEVSPDTALNQSVSWNVTPVTGNATITSSGVFTATVPGTVTITATANDGSEVSVSRDVNIYDTDTFEPAIGSTALHLSSSSVAVGKQTTVTVSIDSGSDANMMQFGVRYDSSVLSLVNAEVGSLDAIRDAIVNTSENGIVYYSWDSINALDQGGSLLELTFRAIGYNEGGTLVYIDGTESDTNDFTIAKVSGDGLDTEMIPCVIYNGSISILNVLYGDVNNDGKINIIDANIVRRYSAKLLTLDYEQMASADVNGDNKVNVLDANYIRRYSAKLIDSFPAEWS